MSNEIAAAGGIGRRIHADVALAVAEPTHPYVLRLKFVIAKDPLDGQTRWIRVFTFPSESPSVLAIVWYSMLSK